VPRASDSIVAVKEEEMDDLAPGASADPVQDARPPKAEPESEPTGFNATTVSACPGTDGDGGSVSRRYLLAVQSAERTSDSTAISPSMRARSSGAIPASRDPSKRAAAGVRSAFAYGLQPYKAVHDVMGNVRVPQAAACPHHGNFCLTALFLFRKHGCEKHCSAFFPALLVAS
jgi:hypothetical protein